MTKRFELRLCSNGSYYVYENGTLTDIDFDKFNKENAYALIDKVNALYDENGQLRKENDMLSCELSVSANKEISRNCRIAELQEENEQLKQFKEKVFTWIDKEIARNEEAIKWGKETGADSSAMEFYNHMLKRLKKELEE